LSQGHKVSIKLLLLPAVVLVLLLETQQVGFFHHQKQIIRQLKSFNLVEFLRMEPLVQQLQPSGT
ncbi:hypothetical protein FRX31_033912, partial [Thalictrum thalictroides]